MKAIVTYHDPISDITGVDLTDIDGTVIHHFEFGGVGSSYCYLHQEFACYDNLTPAEREALDDQDWTEWNARAEHP